MESDILTVPQGSQIVALPCAGTIAGKDPNPYDSQQSDQPIAAQLARKKTTLQRLFAVVVPAATGAGIMTGVDNFVHERPMLGGSFLLLATALIWMA